MKQGKVKGVCKIETLMEKSEGEKLHRHNIGYYISGSRVVVYPSLHWRFFWLKQEKLKAALSQRPSSPDPDT